MASHSILQAMTRRKTDSPSNPEQQTSNLKRCLELKDLTMIGIGSTLGAGVYILSGQVASKSAGPAVVLCFAIAAIASILSGMCYAELGCRVPKAGSGYAYLYVCIGELAAFTIGWCLLLSYILGASSVASALSKYLSSLSGGWIENTFDSIKLDLPFCRETIGLSSMILIFGLGLLMMLGIEEASKVTNFCTFANCATLATLIVLFLFSIDYDNWSYPQDADGSIEKGPVQDFFREYYNLTDGVKGNFDGEENSFSNQFCEKNTFQDGWKDVQDVAEGLPPQFQYSAYCQVQEQFRNDETLHTQRNKTDDDTQNKTLHHFISLPGAEKWQSSAFSYNPENGQADIVSINPGYGGFIPFTFNGIIKGSTTCFYGFVGFDAIATTGEEAVHPHRDIPRAIVISLMVICSVYLLISGLLTISFPYFALDATSPFPAAFAYNGMSWIIIFIKIGAVCALTSSLIGAVIPMPRILWNMAQDGLVFQWCAKVSKKSKTPINATIVAVVVAAILAGIMELDILVDVMSIGTLAAYALTALCVLILRYRPDDSDLIQKKGPSEDQGQWSTKLVYLISGWYLLAGLVMAKASIWFEGNGTLINVAWYGAALTMVVGTGYVIFELKKIPESVKEISFKVPLLPYFPLLNLAINLYLMAALPAIIWVQLCVWLAIGFSIYFFYGVAHSIENPKNQREQVQLLSQAEQKAREAADQA